MSGFYAQGSFGSSSKAGKLGLWADPRDYGAVADGTTDNLSVFNTIIADFNGTGDPIQIQMPSMPAGKSYYFSDTLTVNHPIRLLGAGQISGYGTFFTFRGGRPGILINTGGLTSVFEDFVLSPSSVPRTWATGQTYAIGDSLIPSAGFTKFCYVCTTPGLTSGAEPTWTSTEGASNTSGTAHFIATYCPGISSHAAIYASRLTVSSFYGDGVAIRADSGLGQDANGFELHHVFCTSNQRWGFYYEGPDAGAGLSLGCSTSTNVLGGFFDNSASGNTFRDCLSTANGIAGVGVGYTNNSGGLCASNFDGCYAESGQGLQSVIHSPGIFVQGKGEGTRGIVTGPNRTSIIYVQNDINDDGTGASAFVQLGSPGSQGTLSRGWSQDSSIQNSDVYGEINGVGGQTGWVGLMNRTDGTFGTVTPEATALGNVTGGVRAGSRWFPNDLYGGVPGARFPSSSATIGATFIGVDTATGNNSIATRPVRSISGNFNAAFPFATLAAAVASIPPLLGGQVDIKFTAGQTLAGSTFKGFVGPGKLRLLAPYTLQTLGSGSNTGAAGVGTSATAVKKPTGAPNWSSNALVGMLVKITTGAASSGDADAPTVRRVLSNTTDTIIIKAATGLAAGDTFSIVFPGVTFTKMASPPSEVTNACLAFIDCQAPIELHGINISDTSLDKGIYVARCANFSVTGLEMDSPASGTFRAVDSGKVSVNDAGINSLADIFMSDCTHPAVARCYQDNGQVQLDGGTNQYCTLDSHNCAGNALIMKNAESAYAELNANVFAAVPLVLQGCGVFTHGGLTGSSATAVAAIEVSHGTHAYLAGATIAGATSELLVDGYAETLADAANFQSVFGDASVAFTGGTGFSKSLSQGIAVNSFVNGGAEQAYGPLLLLGAQGTITAHVGGGQPSATKLAYRYSFIQAANDNDSVKFLGAGDILDTVVQETAGRNIGGHQVKVYPPSGKVLYLTDISLGTNNSFTLFPSHAFRAVQDVSGNYHVALFPEMDDSGGMNVEGLLEAAGGFLSDGAATFSQSATFNGNVAAAFPTNTPAGTTQTIDWSTGINQYLSLASASGTVTITLSNPSGGGRYRLVILQGATPRALVWPSTVFWVGDTATNGTAPSISTASALYEIVLDYYSTGTIYVASMRTLPGDTAPQAIGTAAAGSAMRYARQDHVHAVSLTGDVTTSSGVATTIANNAVSNTKFRQSGALAVVGRSANSTGNIADIQATAASGAVLRESGSTLAFGTVGTAGLAANAVDNTIIRQGAALSVIGRSANSTGNVADIAGTDGQVLRVNGTALGFGAVAAAAMPALTGDVTTSAGAVATTIAVNAVTDAKFRQSAGLSVVGRSANTTGNTADLTGTDGQFLRVSGTTLGFGQPSTANISDYTTGTWTPAYAFATSGSVTYTAQLGRYTKIGRMVFLEYNIVVNTTSTPLGAVTIAGLPFTVNSTIQSTAICYANGLAAVVGVVFAVANNGATTISLVISSNGSVTSVTGPSIAASSNIIGSLAFSTP